MSTTLNNVGRGWKVSPFQAPLSGFSARDDQRNVLQALLAFACIHEQAARRDPPDSEEEAADLQEEFALEEILELVAQRALSITAADGLAIALAGEDAVVCRVSAGRIAPDPGVRLDPSSGFSGACLRSGETVRCDDSENDSRVNALASRALGARSMLAVPLSAKQRVVGLVEAFSTQPFGFGDEDERSLKLLARLVSAAIRPEEADRLAELACGLGIPGPNADEGGKAAADRSGMVTRTAPRVIIDEKFAPAPAAEEPGKEAQAASSAGQPHSAPEQGAGVPDAGRSSSKTSVRTTVLIGALVIVAMALGWAIWVKIRRAEQAIKASTRPVTQTSSSVAGSHEIIPTTPYEPRPGNIPLVTGVRHWSSENSSTVVVDLESQVQYEAHSLDNPARVYFDLHDTKLAPGLANQSIEVNDPFLKRVRMAQPFAGVTRIVLELRKEAEFSVSLGANPDRLTIEVHPPGPAGNSPPEGTSPRPSPAVLPAKKQASARPLEPLASEFQIVLDAGHGGWDLGTVGKGGLLEKDLVLDVVERLGKLLEDNLRAQVIYTRQDDSYLPLERRTEIANRAKADLFLSIHANYSALPTARGVETYYTNSYSSRNSTTAYVTPALEQVNWTGIDARSKASGSQRLAVDVQRALYSELADRTPEMRNRGVKAAHYVVLTGTRMPAVLAEISFVSSPADEDNLARTAYRQQIARALYKGVETFCLESHDRRAKLANANLKVATK
ncbi:MAG: N-acetylmuramoyl-L-alanine amidase [Acidobacteria bacterium]|nr:N-acetylmuramoyl-L-alanine amidase [Acidobacteriota bacterium]